MIPREILKKIRQIELRTNHPVTGSAPGARASARFNVRPPAVSQTNLVLSSLRPLNRRESRAPIPTGLRPPARGCEERATLGQRPAGFPNRNAVAAIPFTSVARGIGPNPVGVGEDFIPFPQGSSCVATLNYMPESRWDSPNSIASETFAGVSFQPPAQFRRITRAVENRHNTNMVCLDVKVDAVTMKPFKQSRLVRFPAGKTKAFRGFQNFLNDAIDFSVEFITQPRLLIIIPMNCLIKFKAGGGLENDFAPHAARLAFNRCRASARTCSQGMPALGLFRNSWARRSSSSFCSCVSSSSKSPNSKSIVLTSSRRSGSGIRRISSRISARLMAPIYPGTGTVQMKTQPRPAAISHN